MNRAYIKVIYKNYRSIMGTVFSFSPDMYGTVTYDEPNLIPNFTEQDDFPRETISKQDVVDILRKKDIHIRYLEDVLKSLMEIDPENLTDDYMKVQEQANGYLRNRIKKDQIHDVVMFMIERIKRQCENHTMSRSGCS